MWIVLCLLFIHQMISTWRRICGSIWRSSSPIYPNHGVLWVILMKPCLLLIARVVGALLVTWKFFKNVLIQLPLNGKRFIWSRGNVASRIDRAFISSEWINVSPSFSLHGSPKFTSNQRLIHLKLDSINWGPRPFKFLKCFG